MDNRCVASDRGDNSSGGIDCCCADGCSNVGSGAGECSYGAGVDIDRCFAIESIESGGVNGRVVHRDRVGVASTSQAAEGGDSGLSDGGGDHPAGAPINGVGIRHGGAAGDRYRFITEAADLISRTGGVGRLDIRCCATQRCQRGGIHHPTGAAVHRIQHRCRQAGVAQGYCFIAQSGDRAGGVGAVGRVHIGG